LTFDFEKAAISLKEFIRRDAIDHIHCDVMNAELKGYRLHSMSVTTVACNVSVCNTWHSRHQRHIRQLKHDVARTFC